MSKVKPVHGIIGVFDILGYKQVLRNPVDAVVEIIQRYLQTVAEIPEKTFLGPIPPGQFAEAMKSMVRVSFSDTILIAMPLAADSKNFVTIEDEALRVRWWVFLNTVRRLILEMFRAGLPLRGMIHIGDYFIETPIFAGKCIVEAYEMAEKQNWTGCYLSKEARQSVDQPPFEDQEMFNHVLPLYQVPLKNGNVEQFRAINWGFWAPWNFKFVEGDLREAVMESFLKHSKSIEGSTFDKIANTEAFLKFCKMSAGRIQQPPWIPPENA